MQPEDADAKAKRLVHLQYGNARWALTSLAHLRGNAIKVLYDAANHIISGQWPGVNMHMALEIVFRSINELEEEMDASRRS